VRGWVRVRVFGLPCEALQTGQYGAKVPEDYCDLCDLPLSTCIHGMPVPPPAPAPASRVRTTQTRAPRVAGTRSTSAAAPRPASRSTAQAAFRPYILQLLRDAGAPLETDEALLELEILMEDVLRERDREKSPTGEVRWQTAARKERKAMIDEGLIVPAQPGIWELTARGRAQA
jgi:hypothetical protein